MIIDCKSMSQMTSAHIYQWYLWNHTSEFSKIYEKKIHCCPGKISARAKFLSIRNRICSLKLSTRFSFRIFFLFVFNYTRKHGIMAIKIIKFVEDLILICLYFQNRVSDFIPANDKVICIHYHYTTYPKHVH